MVYYAMTILFKTELNSYAGLGALGRGDGNLVPKREFTGPVGRTLALGDDIMKHEVTLQAAVAAIQAAREGAVSLDQTLMAFVRERIADDAGRTEIARLANHKSMTSAVRSTLGQRVKKASTPEGSRTPTFELGHDGAPRDARQYLVKPYSGPQRNRPSPRKFLAALMTVTEYAVDGKTTGLGDIDGDEAVAAITKWIADNAGTKVVFRTPRNFGECVARKAGQ